MSDDQNKTSTIDDLVKELSKNNNSNPSGPSSPSGPPPNLPGVKLPAVDVGGGANPALVDKGGVKPQGPVSSSPDISKPSIPISSRPAVPPLTLAPTLPKSSSTQEYRSSIRTMGEDIASLKSGQK